MTVQNPFPSPVSSGNHFGIGLGCREPLFRYDCAAGEGGKPCDLMDSTVS